MKIKKILIIISTIMVCLSTNSFAIVWPTISTRITQHYSSSHDSIDIGAVTPGVSGDPIYSFSYGNLYTYAYNTSAGYTAHINHPTTSTTQYIYTRSSHMTNPSLVSNIVTSGTVYEGTKIGEMNTTGNDTTGVHLHYHMRYNSSAYDSSSGWDTGISFDPEVYFNTNLSSKNLFAPAVIPSVLNKYNKNLNSNYGIYYEYDPTATEKSVIS